MANSNGIINNKQDEIAFLNKRIAGLEADLRKPEYALPGYQKQLLAQIAAATSQLAEVEAALATARAVDAQPTASSADTTAQSQVARDDSANASAAPVAQKETGPDGRVVTKAFAASTNADAPKTAATGDTDLGTNAPVRTVAQTQSSPSPAQPANPLVNVRNEETGEVYRLEADQVTRVRVDGVGSRGDDAAPAYRPTVVNRLDELYAGARNAIISQDNILDQFGSYTYSLSWYLLDHATYNTLLSSDTKYLNNYTLLAQSGGASITSQAPNPISIDPQQAAQANRAGAMGRSPFFPLDYYLDNFEFDTKVSGTPGTRGAAKLSELSFTLTEPNGISLIANLIKAVNDLYFTKGLVKKGTTVNYSEAQYCMVIRFYGYDSKGNLVIPINQRQGVTDRQAAIEKFIPFRITAIDFKVANKLVEYAIKGAPIEQLTAFSTDRGSIPQNFQFQGSTVKDILVGKSLALTEASADTPPLTDTVFGRG